MAARHATRVEAPAKGYNAAMSVPDNGAPLRELLAANDFEGLEAFFRSLFAGVPHQWHVNNNIQD